MSDFKWAYGNNANTREPLVNLKEKGWQYADIPTAANFNWLFNQLQKDLEKLSLDLAGLKDILTTEIKAIKENAASIKTTADNALEKGARNHEKIEWTIGTSRQICRGLRSMEESIKRYHSNFPTQPWPFNDDRPRTLEDGTNESEV